MNSQNSRVNTTGNYNCKAGLLSTSPFSYLSPALKMQYSLLNIFFKANYRNKTHHKIAVHVIVNSLFNARKYQKDINV